MQNKQTGTAKKSRSAEKKITVAQYLTQVMDASEKSQTGIAQAMGFQSSNVLTLIKKGRTKLPVNRVPDLARHLEIDPYHLLRLAMMEYSPQIWAVIEAVMKGDYIDEKERQILDIIRKESEGLPVGPQTKEEITELKKLARQWKKNSIPPPDVPSPKAKPKK